MPQAMKTGALWWRVAGAQADWDNPAAALQWAERYLHMADGMYMADEVFFQLDRIIWGESDRCNRDSMYF